MAVNACQVSPMQFTVHIAGKRVRCPHGSRRRGAYFGRLRLYCVAKRVAHLTCRLRKSRRIPHQMASSTAHGAVSSTGERFAPRGGCGRTTGRACTLLSVVAGNMYSGKFANQCPPQTFCCVRPNPSLKRSANGSPPGPVGGAVAFSTARAWRATVVSRLAHTLGLTEHIPPDA